MNERGGRRRGPEPRGSHLIQEHLRARKRRAEGARPTLLTTAYAAKRAFGEGAECFAGESEREEPVGWRARTSS
jgi:hypothetical protein